MDTLGPLSTRLKRLDEIMKTQVNRPMSGVIHIVGPHLRTCGIVLLDTPVDGIMYAAIAMNTKGKEKLFSVHGELKLGDRVLIERAEESEDSFLALEVAPA